MFLGGLGGGDLWSRCLLTFLAQPLLLLLVELMFHMHYSLKQKLVKMLPSSQNLQSGLLSQEFHTTENTGIFLFWFLYIFWFFCNKIQLGMLLHSYNPSTQNEEAGRLLAVKINLGCISSSRSAHAMYWDLVSGNRNKQMKKKKKNVLRLFAIPTILLVWKEKIFIRLPIIS